MKKFVSIVDLLEFFKNEETCHKYFEEIRFRDGEYCPHCGNSLIYKFADGKRYRCSHCKKDFTIKTGTIFGESKITLRKWFIAIYMLSASKKGISSVQLAKQVGVSQKTAWFMDHRIRKAIEQKEIQLFGDVEMDETYVGGKEKNKHSNKRVKGTQGRNTKTKTPVFGMVQRRGNVKAKIVEDVKMKTLEKEIVSNVKLGSTLYSDELLSYSKIGTLYPHFAVSHGRGEYCRDNDIHSNTIEGFWALFKRGYYGIYHSMSKKHLQRYVDEFVYRYNSRKDEKLETLSDILRRVSNTGHLSFNALTS
jgi:transposase-like protein